MRRQRYIYDGSIIGDPHWIRKPWHSFIEWKRVACVTFPLLVFCVTNPANQEQWRRAISSSTKKSRWFVPRVTNYGLFSLDEKIEGVVVSGLQQSFFCAFKSPSMGDICEWVADNFCHQKPLLWDGNDLAYTTHRLLCATLILSTLVGFFCPRAPPKRIFTNPLVDGFIASIFYRPRNLLHDLVYETMCVYPALVEMNKIVPKLHRGSIFCTGDETFDYLISSALLIFVFGGGSNLLASRIDGQGTHVTGFSPVIAAALGYYQRINLVRSNVLMRMFGCDLTAIRIYCSSIAWIVFAFPNGWYPRLVAWLAAGLAGSMLAKYHLENIAVWGDVLKFFGWT